MTEEGGEGQAVQEPATLAHRFELLFFLLFAAVFVSGFPRPCFCSRPPTSIEVIELN